MRRGFLFAILIGLSAGQAAAQTPVMTLRNQVSLPHENANEYIYGDGSFYTRHFPSKDWEHGPSHVLAYDALTGKQREAAPPGPDLLRPEFVRGDYLITSSGSYNRVSVVERATGKTLGSKRLQENVSDARVDGDTVYLLQGLTLSQFRLPGMEFIGEKKIAAIAPPYFVGAGVIALTQSPSLASDFLFTWKPIASPAAAAPEKSVTLATTGMNDKTYCRPKIATYNTRHAVIQRGCRQFTLVDIERGAAVFEIPLTAGAHEPAFALTDRLLFVRPEPDTPGMPVPVAIFDLAAGKELARQILPRGNLYGFEDKLIVNDTDRRISPDVWVYEPDPAALLSSTRIESDLTAAVAEARSTDDPYRAAERIESVSLAPLRDVNAWTGSAHLDAAALYARLLALDPLRSVYAIEMLQRLVRLNPGRADLIADLERAQRLEAMLDPDARKREAVLTPLWLPPERRPLAMARSSAPGVEPIDDKHFLQHDFLVLDGERAFAAQDYYDEAKQQAINGVRIYDRNSWRLLTTIAVAPSDDDIPDHITGLAVAGKHLWVSITPNHYKGPDQLTMFVFDLDTYALVKSWHHDSMDPYLHVYGDVMLAHTCGGRTSSGAYDLKTFAPVSAPLDDICSNDRYRSASVPPGSSIESYRRANKVGMRATQVSRRYLVDWISYSGQPTYTLAAIESDAPPFKLPRYLRADTIKHSLMPPDLLFTSEEDIAVGIDSNDNGVRFIAFDIAAGTYRTLLTMPPDDYRGAATDGKTVFAAFGTSLMAFDMRTAQVIDFSDVLIDPDCLGDTCVFPFRIDLRVDRGRLLVFGRERSTVIDLAAFYKAAATTQSPFASTWTALMRGGR